MINDKFTIGLAYRWSAALSAMAGFQVADFMFMGMGMIVKQPVWRSIIQDRMKFS